LAIYRVFGHPKKESRAHITRPKYLHKKPIGQYLKLWLGPFGNYELNQKAKEAFNINVTG
jgi:hypothetical protein